MSSNEDAELATLQCTISAALEDLEAGDHGAARTKLREAQAIRGKVFAEKVRQASRTSREEARESVRLLREVAELVGRYAAQQGVTRQRVKASLKRLGFLSDTYVKASDEEMRAIRDFLRGQLATATWPRPASEPKDWVWVPVDHELYLGAGERIALAIEAILERPGFDHRHAPVVREAATVARTLEPPYPPRPASPPTTERGE